MNEKNSLADILQNPIFSYNTLCVQSNILDKLAQLRNASEQGKTVFDSGKASENAPDLMKGYKQRALARALTDTYLHHFANYTPSPLLKSYRNSTECSRVLTKSPDGNFESRYCKARWCLVCNRIRTGYLVNQTLPVLAQFKEPYFLTLTRPNVNYTQLKNEVQALYSTVRVIMEQARYRKIKVKGIRKTEVTYNADNDTYHPHYHWVVDGCEVGEFIKRAWLQVNTTASPKAQDLRPANERSLLELFKYCTKIFKAKNGKLELSLPANDAIFNAMYNRRTFQGYGLTVRTLQGDEQPLEINEDEAFKQLATQAGENKHYFTYRWDGDQMDWVHATDFRRDVFSGFSPTETQAKMLSNVHVYQ